ncbi:MAG: endolytic transglycosylase MltG, partial [Oscillospiraceae bacterium]
DNIPRDVMRFNQKEGYAFPDTYTFYLNEDTSSVSKRLLNNFSVKTDPIKTQIEEGMKKYNLTFDQIITLASIIQAESSDIQHMNQVAGVFHNRLKNSVSFPKLQSDPTTLYSKNVIGALSDVQNQKMLDAYDTYTGVGLPPSAICSPGVDAILAAVSPEESEYYYFVTDKSGNFYFAKTYDEHRTNCKKAGITVPY